MLRYYQTIVCVCVCARWMNFFLRVGHLGAQIHFLQTMWNVFHNMKSCKILYGVV